MQVLRHALAILVLPFTMVVLVPRWLLSSSWSRGDTRWDSAVSLAWLPRIAGVALIVAGFALFAWCISLFARVGKGTLAPWDPTRNLVAAGPYRYLRNPMITGVVTMLAGLALFYGSRVLAAWAGIFFAFNHVYFVLVEERELAFRFGRAYETYKATVPRWLPTLRNRGQTDA